MISANMSGRHCLGHAGRGRKVKRTKPVSLTFKSVAEEWLSYYPTLERVRESTMQSYRGFTERNLIPTLGPVPITSMDVDRVEAFIASKRQGEGKLKDSSLRTGLLALRLILKRAKRRGLIPASPMPDVEWQGAKRTEHVDPFTAQELGAIFEAADTVDWNFGTMLRVWAGCGARAGEVSGLQAQDLDVTKGTVCIRRTFLS
jgi:integrase